MPAAHTLPTRTMRVDQDTARVVDALALFLRRTRQSILREAVELLLQARKEHIDAGAVASIDHLARHGAAQAGSTLVPLASMPLSKRFELQRFAIRQLFVKARCPIPHLVSIDQERENVELLVFFHLGLDWVDRDELRRSVIRLLDASVSIIDGERLGWTDQARVDELLATTPEV